MKKITFILALLASTMTFAQNIVIDRADDNPDGTGLISTEGNDGTAVYCADNFEITSEVFLGSVTAPGFSSSGADLTPLTNGFNVFIYEDNGGVPAGNPDIPGSGVVELDDVVFLNTDNNFTVDFTAANGGTQLSLAPGSYWIVMAPSVDTAPTGNGRWNWAGSATVADNQAVLIDPADLFGAGATDWTNISGLIGANFESFAWTLIDEPELSINSNIADLVSVYPNPASDVLNLKVPSNIEVNSVAMYDVLGKRSNVSFANGQVKIASLAKGVYILSVETNAGTLTQKIVKN